MIDNFRLVTKISLTIIKSSTHLVKENFLFHFVNAPVNEV